MQPRREYGDAPTRGNKSWLWAALAAVVVAVSAGYFFLMRPAGAPSPAAATNSEPVSGVAANTGNVAATTTAATGVVNPPAVASSVVEKPKAESTAPAATTVAPSPPTKAAPEPVKALADAKAREPGRPTADEQAKAQKDTEEKAKARQEAQEKAAKAKLEADERAKARARIEADERAAAAQAAAEERARRERAEEAERQTALRTAQEAEKRGKASSTTTPPPVQRSVNELSALALAAYKRGELLAARGLWNEIASHPEASARSRATAYSNQAMSYCLNGDESNCERYFTSALRADRSWSADAGEREHPHVKPSYTRALRAARGGY